MGFILAHSISRTSLTLKVQPRLNAYLNNKNAIPKAWRQEFHAFTHFRRQIVQWLSIVCQMNIP